MPSMNGRTNRAMAALLGTVLGVCAWTSNAAGQTLIDGFTPRDNWYQSWVAASAIPTPSVTVKVSGDTSLCGTAHNVAISGCSFFDRNEIVVNSALRGRRAIDTLMHELGHVFDRHYLDDRDRRRFGRWLGARGPWHSSSYASQHSWARAGGEQFAEAYRLCSYPRRAQLRRTEFRRGGVWITDAHTSWRWGAFRRSCRLMAKIHRAGPALNP